MSRVLKTVAYVLWICAISTPRLLLAVCPMHLVIVKGNVEHAGRNAIVRVQLLYPKQQGGDSSDETVEDGPFTLQVPFYTQSHHPVLVGSLAEKCNREPESVVISLLRGDQEYDRVSLKIKEDFTRPYESAYVSKTKIVLRGSDDSH